MKLLTELQASAAIYGITAWICVVVIIFHVAMDMDVTRAAGACMLWLTLALPVFAALDMISAIIRWVRR